MVLDMNNNAQTNELLSKISAGLTGEKVNPTPQSVRFIYCASANDAVVTTLLGKYGISYRQATSLQTGVDEFTFSCDESRYSVLYSDIIGNQLAIYISNTRLPIQASLGGVTVTQSSPSTLLEGKNTTNGTAKVLVSTSTPCTKVTIRANSSNTVKMYVGNATAQEFELYAGESLDLNIANLNTIYFKSSTSATVEIDYIGG